jgi:hypothetical protein
MRHGYKSLFDIAVTLNFLFEIENPQSKIENSTSQSANSHLADIANKASNARGTSDNSAGTELQLPDRVNFY